MTTLAAPPTPTRLERLASPARVLGGLAVATVALRLRDPHQHASWGLCPLAAVGIWCPACGGLRSVNDLTHGDLLAAASSNLAFIVALPFLVAGLAIWTVDRWRGVHRELPMRIVRPAAYAALVLLAVFTVARNLPFGSWLAP